MGCHNEVSTCRGVPNNLLLPECLPRFDMREKDRRQRGKQKRGKGDIFGERGRRGEEVEDGRVEKMRRRRD